MARTPKTPASAARATSTPIVRVEKYNTLTMGRTTTSSTVVSEEAKLPVAAAVQQTVANSECADGCVFSPDEKAMNYRDASDLQPDLYWRSTPGDTTRMAKKHQFNLKAKDTRGSESGQPKRGRPKMTNGRRGG